MAGQVHTFISANGKIPLERMPFVGPGPDGRGRIFWNVEPPEDYEDGFAVGHRLALAALQYDISGSQGVPWLLGAIASEQAGADSMPSGAHGVILGFWNMIGVFAAASANPSSIRAMAKLNDDYHRETKELMEQMRTQERQARSDRARKAAKARWAKARANRD